MPKLEFHSAKLSCMFEENIEQMFSVKEQRGKMYFYLAKGKYVAAYDTETGIGAKHRWQHEAHETKDFLNNALTLYIEEIHYG